MKKIKRLLKRLYLWFWWNFVVVRNELHYILSYRLDLPDLTERREIANFLSKGGKIKDIPDEIIDKIKVF